MKIGIEATSATEEQKAGVGYYTYNIIRALAFLNREDHCYTLYLRKSCHAFDRIPGMVTKVLKFPYLWAQIRLPIELWRHPQDVYFFPCSVIPLTYQPENSVITIHDVAFLFFPDYFSPVLRRWLHIATEHGIQKAKKIITVSETTRQDLIAYYNVSPEKIIAIHHGVHEMYHRVNQAVVEAVKKKYRIEGDYILCVGTLQRRKNIPRLLQAFCLLKQKHKIAHKLVLVGQKYPDLPEHEIFSTIEHLLLQKEVIWTGYIAGQDMPALFTGAELFVLPSLYEGFGMPVLEAMACGVPVACSNISSLPEVVGESGMMFDPYNVENMARTIHRILLNKDLQGELKQKGLQRAKTFTWKTCAQKTLEVLKEVGNQK